MAVATSLIIAGIGLALSAVGTGMAVYGAVQQQKAQQRQEQLRQQQMNLDVTRKRRAVIRQMQASRAMAVSNATSQGASPSDSSVQGGISQAVGNANASSLALEQNANIGVSMFAANAQESAGRGVSSLGGALQSWGSGLVQNASTISRVGAGWGAWSSAV
jgi:hypothetical protein